MSDPGLDEIQHALRDVAVAMRARPTPDVAPAVRARLEAAAPARTDSPRWQVLVAAALAAVALALVPGVRSAVADLIDSLPGITLRTDQGGAGSGATPRASEQGESLGAALGLTGETDLATARAEVPYELPLPAGLGEPEAVYVREGVVTMLWRESLSLPALGESSVGLVIDVVDGSRGPVFEKLLLGVDVEWFEIDGAPAAWVQQPHPLVVVNADGMPDRDLDRVAARTLLVSGTTTIRLESMLTRDEAVVLIRSLS